MINLTKETPKFNFDKTAKGDIRINLNWNRKQSKPRFFGLLGSKEVPVDLDLGLFIQFKDGRKDVVQALGNAFGSLKAYPYVLLDGDDRTGENTEGEWITINGARWDDIDRILIYTFIYDGVPNWNATDATATIYVPGMDPIRMVMQDSSNMKTCAMAQIKINDYGAEVLRLNTYHTSQSTMDAAYNWGFSWSKGRK